MFYLYLWRYICVVPEESTKSQLQQLLSSTAMSCSKLSGAAADHQQPQHVAKDHIEPPRVRQDVSVC